MTEHARQSLSALMDDEGGEFEVRKLLAQVQADPELTRAWSRYHAVRAVMAGEYRRQAVDLSTRVAEALEAEPAHRGAPDAGAAPGHGAHRESGRSGFGGLWRTLGSMAVAASVTAVIILNAQQGEPSRGGELAASEPVVISQPSPPASVQRARFGQAAPEVPMVSENDVIRHAEGFDHYVRQHQALSRPLGPHWLSAWIPEGFSPVRHEMNAEGEVMLYSNGRASFSVTVEPYQARKAPEGAAQLGEVVALGKRVDHRFVTVVGHVPLMIADRIASSIHAGER